MKWYQLNIEGQQPPVRISHASTILLSKQQQDTNGASCSNYSVNDLGTIAFFGGGINGINSGLNNNGNNYTDLAFLSVGIGATDDIAKPQNTQSMGKLNKLLGSNVNNSNAANSSSSSSSNGCSSSTTTTTTTTTSTTATTTSTTNTQQKPIGFVKQNNSINNNNSINGNNGGNQIRKTYSKLPIYTGSTIFHWENSLSEGDNPLNRMNHSLTSLNNGSYRGKILLIGGQIANNESNQQNITRGGNNNNNNNGSNSSVSLSNDIHLLDCESLFWVKCTASGTQPEPRHSHFVHQISNDTVLLFGGIGESNQILSDIHLLNISNQNVLKWTQPNVFGTVFNLKDKDYKVCFSNGFLWIIISECMEMYRLDINTFRWSIVVYSGNFPRGGFSTEYTNVAGCFGNIIVLLVENEIFFFDTVTLEWGELEVDGGERPIKRKYHTVSVIDSMLVVVGGQSELPLSTINTRDIEMIDLKPLFIKKKIIK